MLPRRSFLRRTGAVLAAATGGSSLFPFAAGAQSVVAAQRTPAPFRLGMAGFTFNKFKLEPTLEMLKQVDVHWLCIKDFHLPLKSTDEEIAAFHAKCKSYGVAGYGVGPIYMGSEEEVNAAFAYAKRVGVKVLVGVPFKLIEKQRVASPELLQIINAKVQEYDLYYAIHNHGPDMPELFPTAESAMAMIAPLDKRVGLCLDIGHQFRAGRDPVQAVTQYADRLHDVHLKNVTTPNKQGRGIELPRGAIDLPALVRALRQIEYRGVCGLEYEKDMDNPLLGIAESIGYFRGVVDATS
jgi:inosose dehydratase